MPLTELWPFGRPNESENRFLFVHLGYYAPTGLGISDGCSPSTFIKLDITTPHCRLLPRQLFSQSSPRWWIACAITKKPHTRWADGETPKCACDALRPHALHVPQPDHHLVLDGDNLHFDDGPHTSIADWFASKQNLPTFQGNPDIASPGSADVDYPELTPFLTKGPYWWALAPFYSIPLPQPSTTTCTHKDIGPLQTSLPRSHLPQRGQASYIPTNLLPRTLLPVPHHHLRPIRWYFAS